MKRVVIVLAIFLLFPLISSEIIIDQQPNAIYNLGDMITVPFTVKTVKDVSGNFQVDLICATKVENFYKNGVWLKSGEEKTIETALLLEKSVIGEMKGTCKVKALLSNEYVLSNEFVVSDFIDVQSTFEKLEFSPGEVFEVTGNAIKNNGENANGILEINLIESNKSELTQKATVEDGVFSGSIQLPKDLRAGNYLARLEVYEEDLNGIKTNRGIKDQEITIKQVPTKLDIFFGETEIVPGTNLKVKAILRDQSGIKIPSTTFITIKNENNKIMQQVEVKTDEFVEFPIAYNELPSTWKVVAASNKLTNEMNFEIIPKEDISINLVGNTITVTNTGNVVYNKTAIVKIGNDSVGLDVYLKVDQSKDYLITAPDGKYNIEIATEDERESFEGLALTGNAIDVRKAPGKIANAIAHPWVWIFAILVLGAGTFIFFRRSSKESRGVIGMNTPISTRSSSTSHKASTSASVSSVAAVPAKRISSETRALPQQKKMHKDVEIFTQPVRGSIINSRKPAEISSEIKGNKEEVTMVVLNLKNFNELRANDSGSGETLQKIVNHAEDKRAVTYQDSHTITLILAPSTTRNASNEKTALDIATRAKELILGHNKMFRQKISFGISINDGTIVSQQDKDSFKFMALGTSMTLAKKISSVANQEILLDEKVNEALKLNLKTAKVEGSSVRCYSIKEMKKAEQNASFIKSFSEKFKRENKTE